MMCGFRRLAVVVVGVLAGTAATRGTEPLDLIPADMLLCWYGRPFPDTTEPLGAPGALATLLDLGTRIGGGPVDAKAQLGARLLETFGLMIRYPHALVLIDAKAKPLPNDPGARQVDQLRLALVVQTNGKSEAFRQVIQKAVNEQTDSARASLARKKAGQWYYQELRDQRLPDWCVIAWGDIRDQFVLTFGPEVWPLIAGVAVGEVPGLARDPWMSAARAERGPRALIEIFVEADRIRERLDPLVDNRASDFFKAWDAEGLRRAQWALGFEGRALFCVASYLINETTLKRVYADPDVRDARLLATVPDTARYAVFRVPIARLLVRSVLGFQATRGAEFRAESRKIWEKFQADVGFNAERDILAHLGESWVVHNDPLHPLRLPLLVTSLIEIRDEPEQVRKMLEKALLAWKARLEKIAEDTGIPNALNLRRDDDGVWYIQVGPVASVAWTITDRFVVTSWSPVALRSYLEKVGDRAGRREAAK